MSKITLAVIVGNRNFFPDRLIAEGRKEILAVLKELGVSVVIPNKEETKLGAVETWEDAKRCAELFRAHRETIDGILVTLPNFGDEKGVADTVKLSGLDVPILVHAWPDDMKKMSVEWRRDAFCGKISVCSNLRQYGFPYSLTTLHTVHPQSDSFQADLKKFLAVCRVVKGIRRARIGAIGARPDAFKTVRYSEKILQENGISVSTIDLSEIIGAARTLTDTDPKVKTRIKAIRAYASTTDVPDAALLLMAKLGVAISDWMAANDLNATAIQCWTSLQQNYGINACTLMSMMSEQLLPSACEVDVTGVLSMYALQLASGTPSALVDWNNNYAEEPDKCVLFHCGNWPKCFLPDAKVKTAEILGTILGPQCTYGAVAGRTPAGPMTFARITTDDGFGCIRSYVGEGRFTDDPLETFGAKAVVEVPGLQTLMQHVCEWGFEHHVAMSASQCADALAEAFGNYLGWDVYYHRR
ncbi:MAG: L-fucose/L-arabinose isomerase family protein [Candidatus Sumerlaeia bacterium]|nr:L-fucose/L-arabinose isomerase family protein [Candidatus Sumerlaeia bacterium]